LTRDFFSFISVSVAAPTWMIATPPTSLAEPLLQLLAVELGRRVFDLRSQLLDAALDRCRAAGAGDQGRMVLCRS
jgi:hypothetical protein